MLGHVSQSVVNVEEVYYPQGTVIVADPSYMSGKGYTSLRYVWIPNTVKVIGVSAFWNSTTLTTVELEEGTRLEKLDVDSFNGCKSLEKHDFEDAPLVTIAQNALRACSNITSFDFPETLETIGYCAFYQTPLSGRVVFPISARNTRLLLT